MNNGWMFVQDKERLREILSRDEFVSSQGNRENLIEKAINYLLEMIARLFEWTEIPASASSTASVLVLVIAGVGLVFVIYWLAKRMVWEQRRQQALFVHGEKIRSYSDYLHEAKQRGLEGKWREGERSLFLALLVYLQTKAWIRIEQWKTNWEYADELHSNQPSVEGLFRRHARTFDQVWYGQAPVEAEQFWERVQELEGMWREEGQHG